MKTKTITTYDYSELSETAKNHAMQELCDINIDFEWWDGSYYDAKEIGLKIAGFDIGRRNDCSGNFIESAIESANLIIRNHGESCETYKDAKNYLHDRDLLVAKYSDSKNLDIVAEGNEYDFDNKCDDLDAEFLKTILEDYRIILQKEYEYLTSEESIIETIEANNYQFDIDGNMA